MRYLAAIFKKAIREWSHDNVSLLAAALAYYGLFSIAPLFIMAIVLVDGILWPGAIEKYIESQIPIIFGSPGSSFVDQMLNQASNSASTFNVTLISLGVLLFGASGLFVNIRRAFSIIWGVHPSSGILKTALQSYVLSFILISVIGSLIFVFSILSALIIPIVRYLDHTFPIGIGSLQLANFLISVLYLTILFSVVYKALSGVPLYWTEVMLGSFIAALMISVGNFLLELYISFSSFVSVYGAAGSLVVFLFWIYYSAQIFLFGAELIKAHKGINEGWFTAK